jgi:NTE family protein
VTPLHTPPIGLALGGGTARGAAHVGALKVLEDAGMPPVAFAGTSFGAIVAAMAALGAPALEIERVVRRQNVMELWAQAVDFGLHRAALVHGERLERWLDRKVFFGARIEDAERPLAIAATDLRSGAPVVLREGPVARAVRASCALPGIFASVERDGGHLVDGGFVEPVPFAALADLRPGLMLGVHTGLDLAGSTALSRLRSLDRSGVGRWLHGAAVRLRGSNPWSRLVIGLSLSLRSYRHDARAPAGADLITVAPPIAWWDFHRSPVAIEAGERATRAWLARRADRSSRRPNARRDATHGEERTW